LIDEIKTIKTGNGLHYLHHDCNRNSYDYQIFKLTIMKKNMGGADRIIRFIVAAVVGVLFYMNIIEGTLAYVLVGLAGVFVLTSFISFCPLYALVGLNTCKVNSKD